MPTMTVLVLTPTVGGQYFGELLLGITREVTGAGGRVVVVETHTPPAPHEELDETGGSGGFAIPLAWADVSGVVSIATGASSAYLQRLRDAGKTVVLCSSRATDFMAPTAMPDNHAGAVTAVEHLIGHGHTRIGFVGDFTEADIRDRHEAYLQALTAHGLEADPAFVYTATDNREPGGIRAALDLLANPDRPTALIVATDRNAIALMRTLSAHGLSLPGDMAVVGFDNVEASAFTTPSLSSVNQRFDEVGALAGRLVVAQVSGEDVPHTRFSPPSPGLAIRESCGCTADIRGESAAGTGRLPDASPERLRVEFQDLLCAAVLTGGDVVGSPARDAVLQCVLDAERLVRSGENLTAEMIQAFTASLQRLSPRAETLRRITGSMTEYVQRIGKSGTRGRAAQGPAAAPDRLAAALWRLQAGSFLLQSEATETALDEQYVVDAGLLDAGNTNPRLLAWLSGTHVTQGVLALWEGDPASGRLEIAGVYDPAAVLPDLAGLAVTPQTFPPASLIAAAAQGVCVVVPVRTTETDWGLLAVVGEIGTTSSRDAYHHWAALLCASLESERLQDVVRRSALYDALTGLPNRRLFLDRLDRAVELRRRSNLPFAVLFLDLDGFKLINDSLGHQMGDRVLSAIGGRIERELRTVDTGSRFGGDEFAILLHDVEPAEVLDVAERVQAGLSEVLALDGHQFSIRASVGVATSTIEYTSAKDVLRDADTAMYQAKATERGSVCFFDQDMQERSTAQRSLHAEIRRAFDRKQFEVHYQPIVDLMTGRADRFEALVRWRHPTRGLVLPEDFLPHMEEGGLIIQLGHWVIDEVCRQLAAWGPDVVSVSVNVSNNEFWHNGLLGHVLRCLRANGLAADRLAFEITEGAIMRRPDVALRLMREMNDAGIRLHIDEFGTGNSSLALLQRFPVEAFKIDSSFIRDLGIVDGTSDLVRVFVAMGKALGLSVLAEGVETQEQLDLLRDLGCNTGQGFLFAPAVAGGSALSLIGPNLGAMAVTVAPAIRSL